MTEFVWDSADPEVVRVDGVAFLIREVDSVVGVSLKAVADLEGGVR